MSFDSRLKMKDFRFRTSTYLPILAFLIALLCFIAHLSPNGSTDGRDDDDDHHWGKRLQPPIINTIPSTYKLERARLIKVLRRATMIDRTVILIMVDETWSRSGSVLELFLESFRVGQDTQKFLNNLVIVTMDNEAYGHCQSMHPHCVHPLAWGLFFATNNTLHSASDYIILNRKRNNAVLDVLELGFNVIFTEADVMWLRSPIPYLVPANTLTIACSSKDQMGDGELFYTKADEPSEAFFKFWKLDRALYPDFHASKSLCEDVKRMEESRYEMDVGYLQNKHFTGFCDLNEDMGEVITVHANCCDDLQSKVYDMRLVLDDWMNMKALSAMNASSSWRAPQKCQSTRSY